MASPSTVLSQGFGSWGSVHLLPTLGFGIGASIAGIDRPCVSTVAHMPSASTVARMPAAATIERMPSAMTVRKGCDE